jgi:hypothetical protein
VRKRHAKPRAIGELGKRMGQRDRVDASRARNGDRATFDTERA